MNTLKLIAIAYFSFGLFESGRWYEQLSWGERKRWWKMIPLCIIGAIIYPAGTIAGTVWKAMVFVWKKVSIPLQIPFWWQYLFQRKKLMKTFTEMQRIHQQWEPTLSKSKKMQHRMMLKCLAYMDAINDYDPAFVQWAQINVYQHTIAASQSTVYRIKDAGSIGYGSEEEVYKQHYRNLPQYKQWKTKQ